MTSKDSENDWIDEHFNDECSFYQIGRIEQLLYTSAIAKQYLNINLNDLTYGEAAEIIRNLEENDCPRDCRDQFQEVLRRNYEQ
tara:strand:+ start:344 stop:595 length:252 start_codon:yes stop_codon:yes gene_type:complete